MKSSESVMHAAGMGSGGNRWMLRQSLLLEAKEMDLAMYTILREHHRCCRDGHSEHGELLREEHRRLARQHATKEKEINTLTNSLVESTLQEVSLSPAHYNCTVSLQSCCRSETVSCTLQCVISVIKADTHFRVRCCCPGKPAPRP